MVDRGPWVKAYIAEHDCSKQAAYKAWYKAIGLGEVKDAPSVLVPKELAETLRAESAHAEPVEPSEELEENHDAITSLVAELTKDEPDIVILCKPKDRDPFERRMDGESAEAYNARWEGYTAKYGYDPAGRRGGWEPSWKEELAARASAK